MDNDLKLMLASLDEGGKSVKKISVKHYWCGGAQGSENDWVNPANWYNRNVPGWFDEVVISGDYYLPCHYPQIDIFANDIAQLIIEKGGELVIGEHGKLSIDGMGKKGIGILNEGEVRIYGELTIQRTTYACIRNFGQICNTGSLALDKNGKRSILQKKDGSFLNFGELIYL